MRIVLEMRRGFISTCLEGSTSELGAPVTVTRIPGTYLHNQTSVDVDFNPGGYAVGSVKLGLTLDETVDLQKKLFEFLKKMEEESEYVRLNLNSCVLVKTELEELREFRDNILANKTKRG